MTEVAQDYGSMLIGGLLAFGTPHSLSGCVNMQFFVYWQLYSYESWRAKSLVIATWLLDLCHSAFLAVALWDSIIVPYGDMDELDKIPWSVGPAVELTAMITFLVQSFFAYRIYRLQKKRLAVVIPIVTLAFFRLVAASVSMAEMIRLRSYAAFVEHPFPCWIFTLGLSLSVFVDIMITAFMCYFLRKNRSMVTSTTRIIDTLTVWTIRNGSVTSAAAVASLICWLAMPENRIFLGLHFVIAKCKPSLTLTNASHLPVDLVEVVYAISLLATLNARQHMRNGKQYNFSSGYPLPIVFSEDWENAPEALRSQHGFPMQLDPYKPRNENTERGQTIQVNVERVVESKFDDGCTKAILWLLGILGKSMDPMV
ncbi:hypothetical protein DEU56DRAFT_897737 [Suillus clintonianus]|uniref:uncharacterized protein n=1 Tax=Suillus clintonianus TaxID=1904413 RepID=UPI001B86DA5E|nr:uncharacterized protein DEU56DRAFT_897737 [Suillus clintonianus]KAG2154657.1 hypothetical protein DEU56DRAFT_897737 [Suillus clintonianus]